MRAAPATRRPVIPTASCRRGTSAAVSPKSRATCPSDTGITVEAVEPRAGALHVRTDHGSLAARAVVAASGALSSVRPSLVRARVPATVQQLHSDRYRGPDSVADGAVLVVGSGSSGMQIAEELALAGRDVFLATGRVARVARRYRGRDMLAWWDAMGRFSERVEDLRDPATRFAPIPHVSGADGGHTLSYQRLARLGVRLLGRVARVAGGRVELAADLGDNVRHADEASAAFRRGVDEYVARASLVVPGAEPDEDDAPAPQLCGTTGPTHLDLRAERIAAVVWCTGFAPSFGYLPDGALAGVGGPVTPGVRSRVPGIYLVGLPWLTRRASPILYGIGHDAAAVARAIVVDRRSRRAS